MSGRVKRWLKEHPRVQAYVDKDDYEKVEELAKSMNTSVSDLVKKAIVDLKHFKEETYEKGFDDGFAFMQKEIERRGPFLSCGIEEFTVPCPKCEKPILFSSRDERFWREEVKPRLLKAFSDYTHEGCG